MFVVVHKLTSLLTTSLTVRDEVEISANFLGTLYFILIVYLSSG
jgi:hypothetical protein